MKFRLLGIYLFVFPAVLAVGIAREIQFLPATDTSDGFALQLAYMTSLVQDWHLYGYSGESWLVFVHLVRWAVTAPFLFVESIAGPAGPIALLLLLLLPLTHVPGRGQQGLLTLVPMALPLFISGRGVLVAVGVGYVVMYLIEHRGAWMLLLGVLLANLSSASVLMCLLLLAFGYAPDSRGRAACKWQRVCAIALLAISLAISAQDKITGFSTGQAGYDAQVDGSDDILIAILSRSTLFVSLVEGQSLRFLLYSAVAAFLLVKFVALIASPRRYTARRILLCCMPGILLEGLGVLAMIFPLIWLFAGFNDKPAMRRGIVQTT